MRWCCYPARCLIDIPHVARFEVSAGQHIAFERTGADDELLRLYLLGSVLGALWHQRGRLPLHAGALLWQASAWAFVGASGAGKSTLVTTLAELSGAHYLCDDVCVVDVQPGGGVMAWPGLSRVRASRELCTLLNLDRMARLSVTDPWGKLALVPPWPRPKTAVPLAGVVVLESGPDGPPSLERLTAGTALAAVLEHTYRIEYLSTDLRARHLEQCATLVRQVPVYRLRRRWNLALLPTDAPSIAALLRSAAVSPGIATTAPTGP